MRQRNRRVATWVVILLVGLSVLWLATPEELLAGNRKHRKPRPATVVQVKLEIVGTPTATGHRSHRWKLSKSHRRSAPSISISTIRDLQIHTMWKRLSGDHLQTLVFYSPGGKLYQQRVVPFSTITPSSPTRVVPGIERPVDVQQTTRVGGHEVVVVDLPVAGTWITGHRLLGLWRIEVYLNDDSAPITTSTFTLTD